METSIQNKAARIMQPSQWTQYRNLCFFFIFETLQLWYQNLTTITTIADYVDSAAEARRNAGMPGLKAVQYADHSGSPLAFRNGFAVCQ